MLLGNIPKQSNESVTFIAEVGAVSTTRKYTRAESHYKSIVVTSVAGATTLYGTKLPYRPTGDDCTRPELNTASAPERL